MPRTHFHTIYDEDTEIFIEYTQTPYDPGRTSGPPEDCYPPEGGEVEIISVTVALDDKGNYGPYPATNEQIDEWTAEIERLPIEDDYGPDPDYEYDRMRDERMMGYED